MTIGSLTVALVDKLISFSANVAKPNKNTSKRDMGTITRLENYGNDGYKTLHFLKIWFHPLSSSYSPNGRKNPPCASKSACFPFNNLALIQDNNLLCPLSNGQGWAMKIKVLSKAMRLSTPASLSRYPDCWSPSSKIKTRCICQESTRQSDSLTLTT